LELGLANIDTAFVARLIEEALGDSPEAGLSVTPCYTVWKPL
jgi:hypothetical protein